MTHTLNLHAGRRGLLNAMIEIRNDLITEEAGQSAWAMVVSVLATLAIALLVVWMNPGSTEQTYDRTVDVADPLLETPGHAKGPDPIAEMAP